ncbi:MAG TPA: hypothetical protein VMU36_07165 [Spirochaetia bacterium]|nr:hypothetical protein [Spirochaetia bacterium]
MTPRERLETVLAGGTPDAVPFFPVLRFWWAQQEEKGTLPERWKGEGGLARLHAEVPCGTYWPPENHWRKEYSRCAEKSETRGFERVTVYETPRGALRRVERFLPESQCWAPIEWPVKSRVDLRALCFLAADRRFLPDTDAFLECVREWGSQGLPLLLPPVRSPICALVYEWTGVECLSFLLADCPAEVEGALKVLTDADDPVFEILCRWPCAPLVEMNDNLSSEVMAGLVRRFGMQTYARRASELHAAGKLVSVHIDGTLRGLLPLFPGLGFDCMEGLTPLPAGDLDIQDLRVLAGPNIRLWGGLPGAIFSPTFPEEEFRRAVAHALDVVRKDHRFILGIGDLLPPDGILDRVKWVSSLVEMK